jgi:glycosyltransferase involved in cell wall biosynthesis
MFMSEEIQPNVSIIIPLKNEQGNIGPLIAEIEQAMAVHAPFEIIAIDDGSTDGTAQVLRDLQKTKPWLKVLNHLKNAGQSGAIRSGARESKAPIIATLDGDGQNDPVFLKDMVSLLKSSGMETGLVQGQRIGRKDTGFKRWQSRAANRIRGSVLKDETRDTGCGLKVFWREVYWQLPYFDALHRFMPALIRREGLQVKTFDVIDRPRHSGVSNYGFFDRLWVGILDLLGVWWLIRRRKKPPQLVN